MTVGLGQDKGTIDSWAYEVAMGLEQAFQRAKYLQAFIQETGAAALETSPYNYVSGDVATLTSAINDAVKLASIYSGQSTQATTYDFTQFLKLLRGGSCW